MLGMKPRPTASGPSRAAIYTRISQDREGRELGVERQEVDSRALAEQLDLPVVRVYCDNDISASTRSTKRRPDYLHMLADANAGKFEVVIAYTSGRVTRKPREHEDLIDLAEQYGIRFEYVRSPSFDLNTSAGRRVARILAATDAGEAEDIQERIMSQKDQAAANGVWGGGRRPFGYQSDGVTVHPDEAAEVLNASREVVSNGNLLRLVRAMNERGSTTSTGAAWDSVALGRMLKRPRNAGLREHRGEVVGKAEWPAIVPEELWRRVVAILSDPARRTQVSSTVRWMGSGLYRCFCGEKVRVFSGGKSRPGARPAYVCSASKHMTRVAGPVDEFVSEVVIERLSREDAIDLLAADLAADPTEAMKRASLLRSELNELAEASGRDELTVSQMITASGPKRRELVELDAQISAYARESALADLVGQDDVAAAWAALDLGRKRAVIKRLFVVELWTSTRGRRPGWKPGESYFDHATVKITPRD